MNTITNRTVGIVAIIILVTIISFYTGKKTGQSSLPEEISTSTSTTTGTLSTSTTSTKNPVSTLPQVNTSGFHSYTNSEYNFVIKYPSYVQPKNTFSTFHELGTNWRLNAGQANQGKNIVELLIHSVDQGSLSTGKQTYPLYFAALVRVGVSPNTKECYTKDAGYTDQKISTVTINGVLWKKFSTINGGMMKYTQAESYRTIHNNTCFAVEQIKNGSIYRDEKMLTGISDSQLSSYYSAGETIMRTFTFTK